MRLLIATTILLTSFVALSAQSPARIAAAGGDIIFTPIIHSSVQVEHAGTVIHVDPWSAGDLSRAKPADLILVTDDPGHHLDPTAIGQLRKSGAPVVLTATAGERFPDGRVLANGEQGTFAGVPVEAVPAYDMTPGRPLHPKGEANGYVVTLGEKRIFFAGVGECVPEIQALRNIDVAFMPMNLPVDRMQSDTRGRMCEDLQAKGRLSLPLRPGLRGVAAESAAAPSGRRGHRRDDRGLSERYPGRADRFPPRRLVSTGVGALSQRRLGVPWQSASCGSGP